MLRLGIARKCHQEGNRSVRFASIDGPVFRKPLRIACIGDARVIAFLPFSPRKRTLESWFRISPIAGE